MDKTLKQAILNQTYRNMTNDTNSVSSVFKPSDLEHLINENRVVFFCVWMLGCGIVYFIIYSFCDWCLDKLDLNIVDDLIFIPIPFDDNNIFQLDEPPPAPAIPNQQHSVSEFEPSLLLENHTRVNICAEN